MGSTVHFQKYAVAHCGIQSVALTEETNYADHNPLESNITSIRLRGGIRARMLSVKPFWKTPSLVWPFVSESGLMIVLSPSDYIIPRKDILLTHSH